MFKSCKDGRHKFEARYSYGESKYRLKVEGLSGMEIEGIVEASKAKTYVCDICVKCGMVIKDESE